MTVAPGPSTAAATDRAGVAFHPPLLLLACIAAGLFARWQISLGFLSGAWPIILGPVVAAASFGLFLWALRTMRSGGGSIPTNTPTEVIVEAAPYSFTRNPIYPSRAGLAASPSGGTSGSGAQRGFRWSRGR